MPPSSTLILRNLNVITTEDTVLFLALHSSLADCVDWGLCQGEPSGEWNSRSERQGHWYALFSSYSLFIYFVLVFCLLRYIYLSILHFSCDLLLILLIHSRIFLFMGCWIHSRVDVSRRFAFVSFLRVEDATSFLHANNYHITIDGTWGSVSGSFLFHCFIVSFFILFFILFICFFILFYFILFLFIYFFLIFFFICSLI
jgi:hypothetical protein